MTFRPVERLTGSFCLTIGQVESFAALENVPMLPGKFQDLDALIEHCEQQARHRPMTGSASSAAKDLNALIDNCEKLGLPVSNSPPAEYINAVTTRL